MDLEVLLEISLLVFFTLGFEVNDTARLRCFVSRIGPMAAIRVIAVVEFVGVDELELLFILVVGLDILLRELPFQRLVVGRIAPVLGRGWVVRATHRRCICPDRIVGQKVLVLDSKLLLVAATGQHITPFLTLFGYEGFLS